MKSVERIAIHSLNNKSWEYTEDLLYIGWNGYGVSVVYYEGSIFVMGCLARVQIITGKNGLISVGHPLAYRIAFAAGIVVHNKIYLFGGKANNTMQINKWMYLDLIVKLSFVTVSAV